MKNYFCSHIIFLSEVEFVVKTQFRLHTRIKIIDSTHKYDNLILLPVTRVTLSGKTTGV